MKNTSISWTHHTFNPWWGCVKVSPACTHCYAERDSKRYGFQVWGSESERRFFGDKHWLEPLKWNAHATRIGERRRVFCASMADVFERHPIEAIDAKMRAERRRLINLIVATPMLDWLLLTKRPENIADMFTDNFEEPLRNVWLGVTAESQEYANIRIPILLQVPAVVRFISYEPALGPLDLSRWVTPGCEDCPAGDPGCDAPDDGEHHCHDACEPHGLHWLIAGGESGGGFRTANIEWYRSARDQCADAGVAFWFKQYSGMHPKQLGDLLDGRQHHDVPRVS